MRDMTAPGKSQSDSKFLKDTTSTDTKLRFNAAERADYEGLRWQEQVVSGARSPTQITQDTQFEDAEDERATIYD